ncbi:hypothetical protein APICC_02131 [Apis cerana cerana]|uniref:Uncharacterized protein n=1 Tax=Apis cerana cerana TaxID=94128 RepID=A0A2A3E002_APICC|nr:hypothetical protein APICC_02131 [Apis cerana cerana]
MVLQQEKQDQQQKTGSATNAKKRSGKRIANNSEKTKEAFLKIVSPVAEKLIVKHIKKISSNTRRNGRSKGPYDSPRLLKTERSWFRGQCPGEKMSTSDNI